MKHYIISAAFILFVLNTSCAFADDFRVRYVHVHDDQVVTIKTSLGIATIIQVPDRPNSVVVGDQEAFKVEYLETAITIKPLHSGAKSNLYVYTDWKRYNIKLIPSSRDASDYVVYLKSPKEIPIASEQPVFWRTYKKRIVSKEITLETQRYGRNKDGYLLIELTLSTKKKVTLKPEWFWLTQGHLNRPIHRLVLSSVEMTPTTPVTAVVIIHKNDVKRGTTFSLEVRRRKMVSIQFPKVSEWR